MRIVRRHIGWVVLGLALLGLGCSSQDDRPGLFEAQVQGLDGSDQAIGSAVFTVEEDETEVILFDETGSSISEMLFRGLPELSLIQEGQMYVVRPDPANEEDPAVRVELVLERGDRLTGDRGTLQIGSRTDEVITGQFFDLEFRRPGTSPIFVNVGEFEALRSE